MPLPPRKIDCYKTHLGRSLTPSLCEKTIFMFELALLLPTLSCIVRVYLIGRRLLNGFSSCRTSTCRSIPLSIRIRLKSLRASPMLYEVKSNGAFPYKLKKITKFYTNCRSAISQWKPVGPALQGNPSRYLSQDSHGVQKSRS